MHKYNIMTKVSPHVQIYKFPITAITSITNRVTGLGITGMYIGLGSSLLFNKNVFELYDKAPQPAKSIINYTVLFPNIYHTFGGIRHFVWDKYPKYLTNVKVQNSSIAILGLSVISTIFTESYILKKNIKHLF
tara:strand:- start:6 stop:404 length:399 start_codon:yes stop_codon:yes gene_type:complete